MAPKRNPVQFRQDRKYRYLAVCAGFLASISPEPLRSDLRGDGLATLEAVCDGSRSGGWSRHLRTVVGELMALLLAAVSARFGRVPRISGGRAPRPPQRRDRWTLEQLGHEVRMAWRSLAAARAYTTFAVSTLALGIGLTTAVFSVVDAVLIRPVPYPAAERLATLWDYRADGQVSFRGGFAPDRLAEWRRQTDVFDRVEGAERRSFIYSPDAGAELVEGAVITPDLMSMLGAEPLRGRLFTTGDGRPGSSRVVIVSERFWRDSLGGSAEAIGADLELDGARYRLVGVMPAAFRYPSQEQDLWVPVDVDRPADGIRASLTPVVRLVAGLPFDAAAERVRARGLALAASAGGAPGDSATLMPIDDARDDRAETSLVVLGVAVAFLLLIVCANVANLTLSKSLGRARDRAVRSALGASRVRLVREALVEHALVGLAGASIGVWVAAIGVQVTVALLPEAMTVSSLNAIDLDMRAMAFLAVTALFTVFAFGLLPALAASGSSVSAALRRESRSATGSATSRRLRAGLVVAEVGLSIVLLVGAALMSRTVIELQSIDIGLDADDLQSLDLAFPAPRYGGESGQAGREAFMSELLDRLRRDPDVERASAGTLPPRTRMVAFGEIETAAAPGVRSKSTLVEIFDIWPRFLETAGIALRDGREFRDDEVAGAAIVSEKFARRYWPDGSAVGASFRIGDTPWRTVVGVAAEVRGRSEDGETDRDQVYYPRDQVQGVFRASTPPSEIAEYRTVIVRAPDGAGGRLAGLVHGVDPTVIVSPVKRVDQQFADAIARPKIVLLLMATFAGFGLLLVVVGLYGVLSHLVGQRLREIGIRLALGATPRDVGRAVFGMGFALTGAGIAVGVVAAAVLTRWMRSLLFQVEPFDPAVFAGVSAVLLLAALAATWRPARRAMRADPLVLLKDQ